EEEIIVDRKSAANDSLVITEEFLSELRRISKAETWCEVVVVTFLACNRVDSLVKTSKGWKRNCVERRAVILVTQSQCQREIWLDSPRIFHKVILVESVRHDHGTAELNARAARTTTGKLIDEVSKGIETTASGKREHAARVERYCLRSTLNIQVGSEPPGMVTGGVGKCVLYLVVIEEPALREDKRQSNTGDALTQTSATEREEGTRRLDLRIARAKGHIESSVTIPGFVHDSRRHVTGVIEIEVLYETRHINFKSRKWRAARANSRKLIVEGLLIVDVTKRQTVFQGRCPIDTSKKLIVGYGLRTTDVRFTEIDVRASSAEGHRRDLALSAQISDNVQVAIQIWIGSRRKQFAKFRKAVCRRHAYCCIRTRANQVALVRAKEEKLVFLYWTTEREAKCVFSQDRFFRAVSSLTGRQRIESAVVDYIVCRSMKLVRATPRYHVYDCTTRASKLR